MQCKQGKLETASLVLFIVHYHIVAISLPVQLNFIQIQLMKIVLIFFVIIISIAGLSNNPNLWGLMPTGFSLFGYLTPLAGLISVILLLLSFSEKGTSLFTRERSKLIPSDIVILIAICAVSVILGWFLRSKNHFLGDGFAFITQVAQPFHLYKMGIADFFVHQLFYRFLGLFGIADGELTYAVFHIILLPLYIFCCYLLAGKLVKESTSRWVVMFFLLSGTTIQLFAGYAESYTFLHLFIAFFLLGAITHLQKKITPDLWLQLPYFSAEYSFMLPSYFYFRLCFSSG